MALPDEHNAGREMADHLFHTRRKPDVLLHPASSLDLDLSSSLGGGGGGGGGGSGGGGGGGAVVDVAPGAAGAGVGAGPQLIVYGALLQTETPFLLTMTVLVLTMATLPT